MIRWHHGSWHAFQAVCAQVLEPVFHHTQAIPVAARRAFVAQHALQDLPESARLPGFLPVPILVRRSEIGCVVGVARWPDVQDQEGDPSWRWWQTLFKSFRSAFKEELDSFAGRDERVAIQVDNLDSETPYLDGNA